MYSGDGIEGKKMGNPLQVLVICLTFTNTGKGQKYGSEPNNTL